MKHFSKRRLTPRRTAESAVLHFSQRTADAAKKIDRVVWPHLHTAQERHVWQSLCGSRTFDDLRACNFTAQRVATREWSERLQELQEALAAKKQDLVLITLINDGWVIPEEGSLHFDLKKLRRSVAMCMYRAGIEGIGFFEFAVTHRKVGEGGRLMMPHVHIIGWTDDVEALRTRVRKLASSKSLANQYGFITAHMKAIGSTPKDASSVACYVLKTFSSVKNILAPQDGSLCGRSYENHSRVPKGVRFRVFELLSYLRIEDLIITHGKLAWDVRQILVKRLKSRRNTLGLELSTAELTEFWQRLKPRLGWEKFGRIFVDR